MAKPLAISDAEFAQTVLASQEPVIVDFWAPWCGPCRVIAPTLEKLASELEGKVTVAKVNTDEHQQWAGQLQIQGLPTLLVFKGGKEVARIVGAYPEKALRERLQPYLG